MNQDKALKKALTRKTNGLPPGFDKRVMEQVMLEAKRKMQLNYFWSLGLVTFVSLSMVVGTVYVLYHYTSFNFFDSLSGIRMPSMSGSMYVFYFYIAFLILILLGLDTYIRNWKNKTEK